jgi:RES domain
MVGCQNCCHSDLFHSFKLLDEDYVPGVEVVSEYDDELEECPICQTPLMNDDYIVVDEENFLDESLKYLAKKINAEIYECQSCNWTIIPYEQRNGDPLDLNMVGILVDSYYIPSDLQTRIYSHLKCRCGNPVNPDDPYVTEGEIKDWFNEDIEFIIETFNVSSEETREFIEFLQENPMLGLSHPIGKTIFDKIKSSDFSGIEEIKPGTIFYRGRTRNKYQRLVPFIEEELWNPPIGIPQQGRYNPPGVTNLYLGNKRDAVLLEISPSNLDIVDIAEFEITGEFKVFNSTKTDIDIFAGMVKDNNGYTSSYEYIFPNFLSQCLAYHGFNGIVYSSVKDPEALNLCLFNFQKNVDICMTKIHTNENVSFDDDPFGLKPKRETVKVENKPDIDYTDIF